MTRRFVEYAPALEAADLARLDRTEFGLFIDGKWRAAKGGATFATVNPATGTELAQIAAASAADVNMAVAAARKAAPGWAALPAAERGLILFRVARLLAERSRELAVLETLDNGKPIRETRDIDVLLAAQHFFYHAGWCDKLEHAGLGSRPKPLGVVGAIIPWNFPLLMAAWKLAPALACGNTVVLKPAETTPLSALRLMEILADAGLPPGVVNLVTGDGATGAALVRHPDLNKVAFTGSTAVGRDIATALAGTARRITLELGGKGANIVFADADLERAVEGVIDGIFFNQGHVCCAGSRLLLAEPIADEFIQRLQARMANLIVGNPLDKNTDVGAINSSAQLATIQRYLEIAEAEGARRWDAGATTPSEGFWQVPTLLLDVEDSMTVCREEIFGPVLSVLTFRTPEEAVAKANNTPYGLACGLWTEKASRLAWVAHRLRAGVIWANTYNRFDPSSPFGGIGESGYGREGGRHGLEAYLNA